MEAIYRILQVNIGKQRTLEVYKHITFPATGATLM